MKNMGIIGGIGPEATMEYYAYIVDRVRERISIANDFSWLPNIIIYSLGREHFYGASFAMPDKPAKIRAVIEQLHEAGADFVIGACNSLHVLYDEVAGDLPIPWLSIMEAAAEAILRANMNVVGLLGTHMTMSHGFYHRALARHGIQTLTPDTDTMRRVDEIISTELTWNKMRTESRAYLLGCIEALSRRGAQGVVLGCTELPLLVKQADTPITLFPTTTILAQRALDYAWGESGDVLNGK
jgi:aspartate racemase